MSVAAAAAWGSGERRCQNVPRGIQCWPRVTLLFGPADLPIVQQWNPFTRRDDSSSQGSSRLREASVARRQTFRAYPPEPQVTPPKGIISLPLGRSSVGAIQTFSFTVLHSHLGRASCPRPVPSLPATRSCAVEKLRLISFGRPPGSPVHAQTEHQTS